ncbi:MAG: diguanylate cyclase [Proteobacteria bacterium]|nr:diguanylate cyclase [Pseudomonadota bacterium]
MEVNRPDAVVPTGQYSGGGQQGGKGQKNQADGGAEGSPPDPHGGGSVAVDGLAAEITPAAQAAFDSLAGELEPLRHQLKLADEREARLKTDLAQHAFLPLPSRREFIRELSHVLTHIEQLTTAPSLVVMHVAGADVVRRRFGRGIYEKALLHVANAIRRAVHPTDAFGSLGGHDFGLILLVADPILARRKADRLVEILAGLPFQASGETIPLSLAFGIAALTAKLSPDAALAYADRDLMAHFCG